nr:unnamed protein product [Digitaria exilis]CAB3482770.1 unnamed protein product [Digitaria exilis]
MHITTWLEVDWQSMKSTHVS